MKLQEMLPKNCFSNSEADLLVYSRDASAFEGKCNAVIWPTTVDHIVSAMHYGKRTGTRYTIRGAATSTFGGTIPADAVVMDMSKMNKIISISNDNVVVQAGVPLDDLNRALGKRKLPVTPKEHAACTIGGMIATNTLGMNTYQGKIEKWILELKVIDGTGKNLTVTGSMLNDFVGKEGITGVIYEAKLKIVPRYAPKTVSVLKFNTLTTMMDKVQDLKKQSSVLSIEFFDEYTSRLMEFGQAFHILVEYSEDQGVIRNRDEVEKIDELKEKMRHILVKRKYTRVEDPIIPLENAARFLHWLRKQGIPCYGHFKSGVLHPCFKEESKQVKDMYLITKKLNGKLLGEYPIGIKRKGMLTPEMKATLKTLKTKYDNQKLLNRGVMID